VYRSKFGMEIAVVEDEPDANAASTTTASPASAPASAFDDPRCPYLPEGTDPFLDDPLWVDPPSQTEPHAAQDGDRYDHHTDIAHLR
jgi:hypothetical protein